MKAYCRRDGVHYIATGSSETGNSTYVKIWRASTTQIAFDTFISMPPPDEEEGQEDGGQDGQGGESGEASTAGGYERATSVIRELPVLVSSYPCPSERNFETDH